MSGLQEAIQQVDTTAVPDAAPLAGSLQSAVDTLRQTAGTAYDSIWSNAIPEHEPTGFEQLMLSNDKIFVVLAVVLLIWIGIAFFLIRTDRKLDNLERAVDARVPEDDDEL